MSVVIASGVTDTHLPRIAWDHRTGGTISAASESPGYEAIRATDQNTYDGWRPANLSGARSWEQTFGFSPANDYCGIGAHDLGSKNCTIRIQYFDGASWINILPGFQPTNDSALLILFPRVSSTAFRVVIVNGDAPPTLGFIAFGQQTVIPQRAQYVGDPIDEGTQVRLRHNLSATGNFLSTTPESNGLSFSLQFNHLSETFRQGAWRGFKDYAERGGSFFVAPRPGGYPDEVAYSWLGGRANVSRQIPNRAISGSVSIDCIGYKRP